MVHDEDPSYSLAFESLSLRVRLGQDVDEASGKYFEAGKVCLLPHLVVGRAPTNYCDVLGESVMPNSPVPPVDTFQAALHYACRPALFDISDTSLGKPICLRDARGRYRLSPFESPRSRSELTAIIAVELFYLVSGLCE